MKHTLLTNNKPLIYGTITGILYFLLCWSIEFTEATKLFFIVSMLFLPGLTFPLATYYFNSTSNKSSKVRQLIHIVLSVAIYYASVWLYTGEGRFKLIPMVAGAFGSLLFLSITKVILNKNLTTNQILITTILSGLAFTPFKPLLKSGLLSGLAVLFWTVINSWLLNSEYKMSRITVSANSLTDK